MNELELKQYLELLFSDLGKRMDKLALNIEQQNTAIHTIEINTTQNIAELKKDMSNAFDKIRWLESELDRREIARQESDIGLGKRIADIEADFNTFHDEQIVKNEDQKIRNDRADKKDNIQIGLLVTVISIILTLVISTLWHVWFP